MGRPAPRIDSFTDSVWPFKAGMAEGVGAASLIRHHLGEHQTLLGSRVHLTGPELYIKPVAAHFLGIALCQLLASACGQGALSTDQGTVRIAWTATEDRSEPLFGLKWTESGGRVVKAAADARHRMMCELLRLALDADTHITHGPVEVIWRLTAAADQILQRKTRRAVNGRLA